MAPDPRWLTTHGLQRRRPACGWSAVPRPRASPPPSRVIRRAHPQHTTPDWTPLQSTLLIGETNTQRTHVWGGPQCNRQCSPLFHSLDTCLRWLITRVERLGPFNRSPMSFRLALWDHRVSSASPQSYGQPPPPTPPHTGTSERARTCVPPEKQRPGQTGDSAFQISERPSMWGKAIGLIGPKTPSAQKLWSSVTS